jgi:hypothetical protein
LGKRKFDATTPPECIKVTNAENVEIYDNFIMDNKTASTAIVSYFITENPIKDTTYNPYPSGIYIHDNVYSEGKRTPTRKNKMGTIFWLKFGRKVPHIIYDGIQIPDWLNADGSLKPEYRICIRNNENGTFANIRADKIGLFKGDISRDLKPYDCELNSLSYKR